MSLADPFVVVQEDVIAAFDQARTLYASWRALSQKRRSPQEENEFQFVTDELYNTLTSIGGDLDDLQETIDVARETPDAYGLSAAQVVERQNFVAGKHKAVSDMRLALSQADTSAGPAASRGGLGSTGHGHDSSWGHPHHPHPDTGADGGQQQQQILIEQQDTQLDSMLDTVRNLHGIAETMNTELDDQAIMLDEVGTLMDRTQSKLSKARQRVNRFLRESSNGSIYTALILFVVILVLLVLIIFT
ncbi:hypothetical protein GGF46_001087 [Coemansia sp. RSA 552]|nr:hypothetical protein GGF46_001087 [Coemansia sp. RSA 552]